MDSKYEGCLAVFSTLGSPFLESSSSRSHYHPSQTQPLTPEQRYTVLSPSRLQHKNCPTSPKKAETLSSPHLTFPPDISYREAKPSNSDSTSPFNESWPSTERSSSSLTPEGAKTLPSEQVVGAKTVSPLKPQEPISDGESVIARYIERFRYGNPTNRKERRVPSDPSSQFWWLDNSVVSEGNIFKKESSPSSDSSQSGVRLFSSSLDQSPLSGLQDTSTLDPETVHLQERAARLLQRSTSPSGNSRHVSSEGLGSTKISSITSADVNLAGHTPHLAAHQCKGSLRAVPCHLIQRSQSCSSMKPEEDILFQWRLRRKMEEASKAVAVMPCTSWKSQCGQLPFVSSMVERVAVKSPEPTSWRNKGRKVLPTSEAHLGMRSTLNEYHPCLCPDPVRKEASSKQLTETTSFRNGTVEEAGSPGPNEEHLLKKPTPQDTAPPVYMDLSPIPEPIPRGEQGIKEPTPQKNCITAKLESFPPLSPAGTRKCFKQTISYHRQQAAELDEKVHIEPKGSRRPSRSKQGRAKSVTDFKELPISPAKQSVQHVLGEVVAERLFSPPKSPALHRDKPKRSSKDWGPDKTMPDSVATPSHPQLLDMAAQLLEQAEDSDGTEFEDDPLLLVLRSQREVLRNQLRSVDIRMAQLEGYHSEKDFSR